MSYTVLVVDDHQMLRDVLSEILELAGHRALTASDGEQGVSAAEEHMPDLVLMDLMMPGVDGFEAVRRIRANPATAGLRVVALTGLATLKPAEAREAGFDGLIIKPPTIPAILSHLPATGQPEPE